MWGKEGGLGLPAGGQWLDGQRHGQGEMHLKGNVLFRGQWEHDARREGYFHFPTGEAYSGDWTDCREGTGQARP